MRVWSPRTVQSIQITAWATTRDSRHWHESEPTILSHERLMVHRLLAFPASICSLIMAELVLQPAPV
jgi:hypothetical protein